MLVDTVAEMLGLDHETVMRLLGELRGPGSHETAELCEPVNDDDDEEDMDEDDFDNEDDDGENCEEVRQMEGLSQLLSGYIPTLVTRGSCSCAVVAWYRLS